MSLNFFLNFSIYFLLHMLNAFVYFLKIQEQIETVAVEAQAITAIREQVKVSEEEWSNRAAAEKKVLAERRTVVETEYATYVQQHAETVQKMQMKVVALTSSVSELSSLTEITSKSSNEVFHKKHLTLQAKCNGISEELNRVTLRLKPNQKHDPSIQSVTADELQSYRNKFHHMRRLATEQQAALVAEKRALLDQIDEISSSTGQKNHAKAIANHFGDQLGIAEEARRVEREASKKEINGLRMALSKERERSEKRAHQHARELANQLKLSQERKEAEDELRNQSSEIEHHLEASIANFDRKTSD